jgi:ABC-type Fe3+-hydroxamate transport system substrate-binding protein
MKITVNRAEEIKKIQSELDDCIESLSVLDNAVSCGFLFDKHSLEIQKWIKEYKQRIEYLREQLENVRTNGK